MQKMHRKVEDIRFVSIQIDSLYQHEEVKGT